VKSLFYFKNSEKVYGKLTLGNSKFAERENCHFNMSNVIGFYGELYRFYSRFSSQK
jgi:hypothetical protein